MPSVETNYTYACKYSTEAALAQAYKEFYDHAVEKYQNLINMVQDAVDQVDENSNIDGIVNKVINENKNNDVTDHSVVALNEGVVYLKDLLKQICTSVKNNIHEIDIGGVSNLNFEVDIPAIQSSNLIFTVSSLFQQLNSTLHAITVEQAVGLAYSVGSSIAEKVSLARDAIGSIFSSAFTDASSCLNDALNCIKNGFSLFQYVARRIKRSGIQAAADYGTLVTSSDDVNYSGASIWGGVMWSTTGNIIVDAGVNIIKAIGFAGKTLWNWISNAGEALLRKVGSWEVHTFANPNDCEVINEKGSGTFDLWARSEPLYFDFNWSPESHFFAKLREGPIKIDTICGEIIFQFDNPSEYDRVMRLWKSVIGRCKLLFEYNEDTYNDSLSLLENLNNQLGGTPRTTIYQAVADYCNVDPSQYEVPPTLMDMFESELAGLYNPAVGHIYLKIKPINYQYALKLADKITGLRATGQNIIDTFDEMLEYGDYYDVHIDSDYEREFYADCATGAILCDQLIILLMQEIQGGVYESQIGITKARLTSVMTAILNADPTSFPANVDFVKLLVDGKIYSLSDSIRYPDSLNLSNYNRLFSYIIEEQDEHPFNMEFYPYVHNEVSWSVPTYRIKSDAEHQTDLANFLTRALAVVIAVVITIVIFKKAKQAAAKSMLEAEGAMWSATEAASQGRLTDALVKNYRKKAFKAKVIGMLTGNLLASSGQATSSLFQELGGIGSYSDQIEETTNAGILNIRRLITRD